MSMELISQSTANGVSSLLITDIPQDYDDLLLYISGRSTGSYYWGIQRIELNATDPSGLETWAIKLRKDSGSTAVSSSQLGIPVVSDITGSSTNGANKAPLKFYIPGYTTSYKKLTSFEGMAVERDLVQFSYQIGSQYNPITSAITSIEIFIDTGNHDDLVVSMYGIKNS